MDLLREFASLPRPSSAGSYSVKHLVENCRIGKTYDGYPALLVELTSGGGAKLPRQLANFAYRPPAAVQIRSGSDMQAAHLAIVECLTSDRQIASYFLRIVTEVLVPEAAGANEPRFEAAIDAVITLFKALQGSPTRTVQGLWAELAMVLFATQPQVALLSWHSNPRALHDFSNGSARLEIKSSAKGLREHTFLLDQLILGPPGNVLIASMLLTESPGGCSVFEIVDLIKPKLTSIEAQNRLERIIATSLGDAVGTVNEHLYEIDTARESLLLYRAEDVPRCGEPPPTVKDVSFTADLSTSPQITLDASRKISAQFRDLLPS